MLQMAWRVWGGVNIRRRLGVKRHADSQTKTMIRGNRRGERFFTLTIRHPSLGRPLNVAAFVVQPDREYVVTFRARQRNLSIAGGVYVTPPAWVTFDER